MIFKGDKFILLGEYNGVFVVLLLWDIVVFLYMIVFLFVGCEKFVKVFEDVM